MFKCGVGTLEHCESGSRLDVRCGLVGFAGQYPVLVSMLRAADDCCVLVAASFAIKAKIKWKEIDSDKLRKIQILDSGDQTKFP